MRYDFQSPKGLVVNTYHDSEHLGFSYVGEAGESNTTNKVSIKTQNSPEQNINIHRRNTSQGIYIFRPNLGQVLSGANNGAFTGGISWCTARTDENKYFGPNRLSTDKDGYVYVCENRPTKESVNRIWRVHHDQMTTTNSPTFTCIMQTTDLSEKGLEERVLAMSVGYINNEKMLYVITGYTTDAQIRVDEGYCHLSCWKIIETGDGNCELEYKSQMSLTSIRQGSITHKLISPVCSVVPGNENGDLWIFQRTDDYNGITANRQFSALHLSKSGDTWNADYHIPSYVADPDSDDSYHQNSSGIGAISTHHVLDDTSCYYLAMPCRAGNRSANPEGFVVKVFRMYKNDTGLHRARWWNLYRDYTVSPYAGWGRPGKAVPAAEGEGIDGIAFDAANNLFFTASGRHMYVYSLPKENEHLTYGPHMLHVPYGTTTWVPNQVTYDLVSGEMKELILDTEPLPVLSKEGYYFHGWYKDPELKGDPITYVDADDLTLYAKWTEIKIHEHEQANNTPIIDLVNNQTVGMKVDRKMPGGSFSTLCLPFAINNTILNAATWDDGSEGSPLAGATLWTFSNVETNEEANTKTLIFEQIKQTDEVVPANTPFLIWPQNDVAKDIFFHNVTIQKAAVLTNAGEVTHDGITFHGFINPLDIVASPNNFFLVADNRLAVFYESATIPALRGYFSANPGSLLQIRTRQETPTLLENINSDKRNTYKIQRDGKIYIIRDQVTYDLQGNVVLL